MKAFVIKNKEGKYWYGYDLLVNKNLFTIKISNAVLNNPTKKNCLDAIKEYGLKDCEIVAVEIEETKEKYFIRDITIEQLRLENEELKSKLAERNVDYWEYQDKICKGEHIGILEKENAVLKKALKLACETIKQYIKIVFDEYYDFSYERFIDKAKEELKNERK